MRIKSLPFWLIGALVLLACGCGQERRAAPRAVDGVVDLSGWDFENTEPTEIRGDWKFVWGELVKPQPMAEFFRKYQGTAPIPGKWSYLQDPTRPGESLPGTGFGSYGLRIKLPNKRVPLAFILPETLSASEWWIYDVTGTKVLAHQTIGKPAALREDTTPVVISTLMEFEAEESDVFLLVHVSNFSHARGGLYYGLKVGEKSSVAEEYDGRQLVNGGVAGILLIIALYHFVLFLQRREDTASLFFGMFCAAFALRHTLTSRGFVFVGWGHSLEGYEWILTFEYISMTLGVVTGGFFINVLIRNTQFAQFLQLIGLGGGAMLIGFTLATDGLTYSRYIDYYLGHTLLMAVVAAIALGYEALRGNNVAKWVLFATGFLLVGVVNDSLHVRGIINTQFISSFTFISFVLMQSAILSGQSAQAFRRVEHLRQNLKREVEEQTEELTIKALEAQEATIEAVQAKEEAEHLRSQAERHAQELKDLDRQKTAFFQNMSHELRTPLTLILSPLEQALRDNAQDKNIDVANKNARRLLRLVNQLLDFQKAEAGKYIVDSAPLNLLHLVRACGDYFEAACAQKGIQFEVMVGSEELTDEYASAHEVMVMGEVDAIEKIIFNFLSNALKFTPRGGSIKMVVHAHSEAVRLDVQDTGPGISREGQKKLFQVFSQVDETTTRAYEGTGLGLALTKTLSEAMEGSVGVESTEGEGSLFYLVLPKPEPPKPPLDLLVVEDDKNIRTMLKLLFDGSEVIENFEIVAEAIEARALFDVHQVRCLLSDFLLGGEDGLRLMRDVSQNSPSTKRVLLTGHTLHGKVVDAQSSGLVDHVFFKPVDNVEVLEVIEKMVQEVSGIESDSGTTSEPNSFEVKTWLLSEEGQTGLMDEDESQDSVIHPGGELVLVVDDLKDMRQMIAGVLRNQQYRVITAANGAQALEKVEQEAPSLVITDWMMPELSGPELIAKLKGDPRFAGTPVVLLTAKSDEESKLIGTDVGADAFLGKPFNEQELSSIVRNLISLKSREREVEALNQQITENVLKRYLPAQLVEDIVTGNFEFSVEPKERLVTMLFSDLCGFTRLGEELSAEAYAEQLNEYLELMNEIIFSNYGTVDKFMGDAIMVIFGAPREMDAYQQAQRALSCARAMQYGLDNLNESWAAKGFPRLSARIGIHQGEAVVGNFGSSRRSDYTCIGRAVNIASRIEGVCEPGSVFVSASVQGHLPDELELVGGFELKGVAGEQRLYKMLS